MSPSALRHGRGKRTLLRRQQLPQCRLSFNSENDSYKNVGPAIEFDTCELRSSESARAKSFR